MFLRWMALSLGARRRAVLQRQGTRIQYWGGSILTRIETRYRVELALHGHVCKITGPHHCDTEVFPPLVALILLECVERQFEVLWEWFPRLSPGELGSPVAEAELGKQRAWKESHAALLSLVASLLRWVFRRQGTAVEAPASSPNPRRLSLVALPPFDILEDLRWLWAPGYNMESLQEFRLDLRMGATNLDYPGL